MSYADYNDLECGTQDGWVDPNKCRHISKSEQERIDQEEIQHIQEVKGRWSFYGLLRK